MHDIISAFERRTGGGVILNTSFNLHGFPIVRTAEEALGVLRESGLEYLQVGDYLVHKRVAAASNGAARTNHRMADPTHTPDFRLGIICSMPAARDAAGPAGVQPFHRPAAGHVSRDAARHEALHSDLAAPQDR